MTQECAIVPTGGMPSRSAAATLLVPLQPPMKLARAARNPAGGPCARRVPKSTTVRPRAAVSSRVAFVATEV